MQYYVVVLKALIQRIIVFKNRYKGLEAKSHRITKKIVSSGHSFIYSTTHYTNIYSNTDGTHKKKIKLKKYIKFFFIIWTKTISLSLT